MSASRSIDQLDPSMTAPWTQPAPLPNKPGGETNLLHSDVWANPLRVEFKPWYEVDPPSGSETVEVFLDDNELNIIGTRTWPVPMRPEDYYIEISADRFPQGEHQISFIMTNFLGVKARSFPYTVTIDKVGPLLNTSSRLAFPAEILPPNKLTARYLDQNSDQVKATLPVYTSPRPWDRITWYWGATSGNLELGGVIELDDKNYSAPVVITIAGQLIRDRKDGKRYVWYQVHDRAGNPSARSDWVELDVAATPIPRSLPPTKIKDVSGTSTGVLNPSDAINGATVTVPPQADIHDGERVFLQWAEQGSGGAHRTETPITPGTWEYRIPSNKVAWHLGKTLPVNYEVIEAGIVDPHKSQTFTLRVSTLSGPPTVQCREVSGNYLSLSDLPDGHANFWIRRWAFVALEQFVTITVMGVDSSNQKVTVPVLTEAPVPAVADEITMGRISRANLQRFKIGERLEVTFQVSFDGKLSWQKFPSLTPTLIA
ncbi:hypothetical protein D3C71_324910 [compost metagenome]